LNLKLFFINFLKRLGLLKYHTVSEDSLKRYIETYIKTYRFLVEISIHIPRFRQYLELYNLEPLVVNATISETFGVSFEFTRRNKKTTNVKVVEGRIEKHMFSKKAPLTKKLKKIFQDYPRLGGNKNKGTILTCSGKYIHFENFVYNSGKGDFLKITRKDNNISFKNIYVNNVHYKNLIEIYGNNESKNWTLKKAINRAGGKFWSDLKSAYYRSNEFKKFIATPVLQKIAKDISRKESRGKYAGAYGAIHLEYDLKNLYAKSTEMGIDNEFTKIIIEAQRKKFTLPSWSNRNSLLIGIIGGLIVYLITTMIDWKIVWEKLSDYIN
jgi:hypothetical protein